MSSLLEVDGLYVEFATRAGVVRAVAGASWDVREGETVALVGESGCGKSATALAVLRLLARPAGRVVGGQVRFKGRDLLDLSEAEMRALRGREIGMILDRKSVV